MGHSPFPGYHGNTNPFDLILSLFDPGNNLFQRIGWPRDTNKALSAVGAWPLTGKAAIGAPCNAPILICEKEINAIKPGIPVKKPGL
jgi:hypothetical protein